VKKEKGVIGCYLYQTFWVQSTPKFPIPFLDMRPHLFFAQGFLTTKTGKTNFVIFFRKNKSRCQRDGVGLGFEVVSASQIGRRTSWRFGSQFSGETKIIFLH
jgi:hypothetical protein